MYVNFTLIWAFTIDSVHILKTLHILVPLQCLVKDTTVVFI